MKQKTKKAARKRFTISARGTVQHRRPHQSHFNAKDTGKQTRRKHSSRHLDASDHVRIQQLLPYA